MRANLLAAIFGLAVLSAQADAYWYVGVSNVWDSAASYALTQRGTGGAGIPGEDDVIELDATRAAYMDDAQLAYLNGRKIKRIRYRSNSIRLYVRLTGDARMEFGCGDSEIYGWADSVLVKMGSGKLTFAMPPKAGTNPCDYYTGIDLREGDIQLGPANADRSHYYAHVTIGEGCTLWGVTNGSTVVRGLAGAGTFTNLNRWDEKGHTTLTFAPLPSEANVIWKFSGVIRRFGKYRQDGHVWYLGEANEFDDFNPRPICGKEIGFVKFSGSGFSSLGACGSDYNPFEFGGGSCLRYLGPGGEAVTRCLKFGATGDSPASIDAGAGNLTLSGTMQLSADCQQRIVLTGTNGTDEAVFAARIVRAASDETGRHATFYLTKSGSGTWRLGENANRGANDYPSGVIAVDEGKLTCDSLRDAAYLSAAGTAVDLYDDQCAAVTDTTSLTPVAYAHRLGSPTSAAVEGTFSYTGAYSRVIVNRPIAIAGNGRLAAPNAPALKWYDVSALGTGEKRFTFECAAHQTNGIARITDTAAAPLTVVKDGAGDLVLSGDLAFHGDLVAKGGGTLTVRNVNGLRYSYYKLTVKETLGSTTNSFYDGYSGYGKGSDWYSNRSRSVGLNEFALYTAAAKRVLGNTGSKADVVTMGPGGIGHENPDLIFTHFESYAFADAGLLDNDNNNGYDANLRFYDTAKVARLDDPSSWVSWVYRLPTSATDEIVSYDLNYPPFAATKADYTSSGAASGQRQAPTAYAIYGSADGIDWDVLAEANKVEFLPTKAYSWLSNGEAPSTRYPEDVPASSRPLFPLARSRTRNTYAVLDNARSVSVAPGTTLKADGTVAAIKGLKADAAGIGTIDGFAFAADGTLEVTGAVPTKERSFTLPADFSRATDYVNMNGWTLKLNGMDVSNRYGARVTADGITITKKGLVLIFR